MGMIFICIIFELRYYCSCQKTLMFVNYLNVGKVIHCQITFFDWIVSEWLAWIFPFFRFRPLLGYIIHSSLKTCLPLVNTAVRVKNRWSLVVSCWKPNLEYSMGILTKLNSEMHEILPECEQSSSEDEAISWKNKKWWRH